MSRKSLKSGTLSTITDVNFAAEIPGGEVVFKSSMTARAFLSSFFGGNKSPASSEEGKRNRTPVDSPANNGTRNHSNGKDSSAILIREEIVDSRNRLCGYRFSSKSIADSKPVPEVLFFEALRDADIPVFAQRRRAVIPISPDGVVFGRHRLLMAPNAFFLVDVRKAAMPVDQLLGRLMALRDAGCKVALAGISLSPDERPLLQAADMLFLDLAEYELPELEIFVRERRLSQPSLILAAESVQSWAEQRMCIAWGFECCLGEFLSASDEEEKEGTLNQSQLASMEILNLLRREAELRELTEAAKKDPGITFQLLKWANSPAVGLTAAVTSLQQAIMVLGREQLYRWLMVSMFRTGARHERDESLLEVALVRARFLETVASPNLTQQEREELFLIGVLSLFDVLLNMPMQKILSEMHLSDAVLDVLLRSTGPYRHYLMLVLSLEKGQVNQVAGLAAALDIATETLEPTRAAAFAWSQDALGRSRT